MPIALRKDFGVALDIAQQGLTPEGAKLLKGKAAGATQLSEDYHGDTWRAVYTVELEECLHVLHCFQKKSKRGAETPKADLDLIETRLKAARALHAKRSGKKPMTDTDIEHEASSGNVFADLGLPEADDLAYKAGLIGSIMRYQQENGLSQSALAALVDIPQPRLSNLFRGKMGGITSEKLIKACARLGRHVRIVVDEHPGGAAAGRVVMEVA